MRWFQDLFSDLRYAARGFGRNPGFTAVAVATIALGLGANTAVFTLVQKLLLQGLPVQNPDELVELDCVDRSDPKDGECDASWAGFRMYSEDTHLFSGMFAYSALADMSFVQNGNAALAAPLLASGDIYNVLGVSPAYGRLLNPTDDAPSTPPVAVLSHAFWRERFNSDPKAIGQTIRLNNHVVTIVGVTPANFRGLTLGEPPDVTLPMGSTADLFLGRGTLDNGTNWWLKVIGRRKPGVEIEQVQAGLEPVFQRTVEHMIAAAGADGPTYRESLQKLRFHVRPAATGGFSEFRGSLERPLNILMALAGIVLMIACANLASLFLSRAWERRHEITVRQALGAGRMRLARQFWTESLILSAIGGGAGLVIARWGGPLILRLASGEDALYNVDLTPDSAILAFKAAAILLTGFLIGFGPVLGLNAAPAEVLRSTRASGRFSRLSRILVPAQVMLASLLLIGAGLFVRTFSNIRDVELGYGSTQLMTVTLSPDLAGYDESRRVAYWEQLIGRIASLPSVKSVTLSGDPIGELNRTTLIQVPGFESAPPSERSTAQKLVSARFVETAGLKLLRGSDLVPPSTESSLGAAVVNESFAQHFFKTLDIVGKQFALTFGTRKVSMEIVGVVADARDRNPRSAPERVMYTRTPTEFFGTGTLGIRTESTVDSILPLVRGVVTQVNPQVPIREIRTIENQIEESLGRDKLLAMLGIFFGGLALLLVSIGLYGFLAGTVAGRTREIGIRMALGAQQHEILGHILRQGLKLVSIGLAAGLAAGLLLTRFVENQLFGVQPNDPVTLLTVSGFLFAVGLVAALIPGWRATRIEPSIALEHD